jgi:hypothetical protein
MTERSTQSYYVREQVGFNMVELTYVAMSRQMLSYNSIYGTMYFLFYFTIIAIMVFTDVFTLCFLWDPVQTGRNGRRLHDRTTTRPHDYTIK